MQILPLFYQTCLSHQLSATQLVTLEILVWLLQAHKQVRLERLAALCPIPIKSESRRRHLQRFLLLPILSIPALWFPLVKYILRTQYKPSISRKKRKIKKKAYSLLVAIDRTQWRDKNLFVVSLIWDKRALPVSWILLSKKGSSNLGEQQKLLRPVLRLLKGYRFILLGDREFRSIQLADWLNKKGVAFALRQKAGTYIRQQGQDYQTLSSLGLAPGMKIFLTGVNLTKQPGFAQFNLAAYWQRKYRGSCPNEGWYILTNLNSLNEVIKAYQSRSGIEAMFRDFKSGGYNLEACHASEPRLMSLVLIIAIAYTCAVFFGQKLKQKGVQQYITRLTEYRRVQRRHSSFWVGLYGCMWIAAMEYLFITVRRFWQLVPHKVPHFERGIKAMNLIQAALST